MKKILLLTFFIPVLAWCTAESFEDEQNVIISQAQENFLQEILHEYPDLKVWYEQASQDEKAHLQQWAKRLVETSIKVIGKADDEFIQLLEDFENITQLTNVKLVTEIDVTLQPADTEITKSHAEQNTEQLSALKVWYESATEGERKQLDDVLGQLFSYINQITAHADEAKMSGLADTIRILTGLQDLQFTLSVQMSIENS